MASKITEVLKRKILGPEALSCPGCGGVGRVVMSTWQNGKGGWKTTGRRCPTCGGRGNLPNKR